MSRSKTGILGTIIIAVVVIIALAAPLPNPADSNEQSIMRKLQSPVWTGGTWEHLFGTNKLGHDVFSRILYGSRVTLLVSSTGTMVAGVVDVLLGLMSDYRDGWADIVIMHLAGIQLAFPFVLPALFIAAVLGPGLNNVTLIAGLSRWISYAWLVRGGILSIRENEYVEALRSMGAGDMRIMLKRILPDVISPVIVIATLGMTRNILIETSLSYLGLGVPTEIPAWGRMLSESRVDMLTSPWLAILPGLFISLTVLEISLFGDWLQGHLDPRLSDWGEEEGMNQHLLSIKNLSVTFHTKGRATYTLENLNLTLDKGEKLGLTGESGSGKSVMPRSILRLLATPPARVSGEIFLEDEGLLSKKEEEICHIRGNRISMVFQEPMVSLDPLFTIRNQLAEVVRTHRKLPDGQPRELLVQSLAEVGIAQPECCLEQYPHILSDGMCQRVVIAMALLCKLGILIADEPTTALDVTIQTQILDLLNEVDRKYGTSIILITHDLGVIAETADTVAMMYIGEIVEPSDMRDVLRRPLYPYIRGLLQSIPSLEDEKEELQAIEGATPSLHELPKGCVFCGHCPYAHPLCNANPPPEVHLGDRLVRCFQYSGQW